MHYSRTATVVVTGTGIAIAACVGYVLHKEARAVSEAHALVSVVGDATAQLKGGLKAVPPDALEKVEAGLRTAKGWSHAERADATEQYLIGAREILRRRGDANRLTQKATASRVALAAHMSRSGGRDSRWIRTAFDLKRQVERDHFDLEMQLNALAELLHSLPEANKRLAPHVAASLLLEEAVRRRAHSAAVEEAKRARAELHRARSLLPR